MDLNGFKFKAKRFLQFFYRTKAITKKNNFKLFFKDNLFTLVDVGATGGMRGNWQEINEFCHYITFDPDPRKDFNFFAKLSIL